MQKGNYLKTTINPEKLTSVDLKEWLEDVHEKYYIELKKAQELYRPPKVRPKSND